MSNGNGVSRGYVTSARGPDQRRQAWLFMNTRRSVDPRSSAGSYRRMASHAVRVRHEAAALVDLAGRY